MAAISVSTFSIPLLSPSSPLQRKGTRFRCSLNPSIDSSKSSAEGTVSSHQISATTPFTSPNSPPSGSGLKYPHANPGDTAVSRLVRSAESTIERFHMQISSSFSFVEQVIFNFRFLAILAVGGSLAGSLLCFLNGCVYIFDAYKIYCNGCLKGLHTGQMVLRLVEAIDVYLAGTVMLIFGMGLYGLFISNVSPDVPAHLDSSIRGSSFFGMFSLKERPKWMKIDSLEELKTKVGHVIVMILLVKMFERSKMVTITTGVDLLSYSLCIFLSSASIFILHYLHKSE